MASGDTLQLFTALHNTPPASDFALLDLNNNNIPHLDFDASANWSAIFLGVMPQNYAGNGITVYIHWSAAVTSGNVDCDAAIERIGEGVQDMDSDGIQP